MIDNFDNINLANLHEVVRNWNFVEQKNYTLPFLFLENAFNDQARLEEIITSKEYLKIKKIDADDTNKTLYLVTDLFKLMEN